MYDYDDDNRSDFQEPGGRSALRAASKTNPRIYPCPDCLTPKVLTKKDKDLGYCCNACADEKEFGGGY